MITKEQAMNCKHFKQIAFISVVRPDKPITWRANGQCKTWKRDATRFSLPVKHGLYTYGYITPW